MTTDLTPIVSTITNSLGIEMVRVERLAAFGETCIVLRLPLFKARLTLDDEALSGSATPDLLLKELDHAQRHIFHDAIQHIAKHDRSPHERIEMIESAAAALIAEVESLSRDHSLRGASPLFSAVEMLRHLIKSNTGALDWRTRAT